MGKINKNQKEMVRIYEIFKETRLVRVLKKDKIKYLMLDIAEYFDVKNNDTEITRRLFDTALTDKKITLKEFISNNALESEFLSEEREW